MGNEPRNLNEPPYSNRGVQNTKQSDLTSCVDWFACTFNIEENPDEVIRIIGLEPHQFKMLATGKMGYKKALYFNNIRVLYDGNENMGIHVEMSGSGCRTFEKYSSLTWQDLFIRMKIHYIAKSSVTRLDIAIDDFKGYFKIPDLIKRLKNGSVTSKFKMAKQISNIIIQTGEELGYTLYFGRPTSNIQIRFYEKGIEQEMKGNIVPETAQIWNRTEVQARDDRAEILCGIIAEGRIPLGEVVTGVLRNYINFRRPFYTNGKRTVSDNKSRWDSAKFWLEFLGQAEKISLTMKPTEITIERKYNWIDDSVKKTLAMLAFAFPADHDQLVEHLLKTGYQKFESTDWDIIKEFREKELSFDEYLEKIKNARPSSENQTKDEQ